MAAPGGDDNQTNSITPSGGVLGAYPAKFVEQNTTFVQNNIFVEENGAYYVYIKVPSAGSNITGCSLQIFESDRSQSGSSTILCALCICPLHSPPPPLVSRMHVGVIASHAVVQSSSIAAPHIAGLAALIR